MMLGREPTTCAMHDTRRSATAGRAFLLWSIDFSVKRHFGGKMTQQLHPYKRAKRVFLLLFLISAILFAYFFVFGSPLQPQPPISSSGSSSVPSTESLLPLITFLTSITTLIGFISTTLLAWRKENREARVAALDVRREEIELEKARLELEKLKLARIPHRTKASKR